MSAEFSLCVPAPSGLPHTLSGILPVPRILIAFSGRAEPGVLQDYLEASRLQIKVTRLEETTRSDIESFQPGLILLDSDDDLTEVLTFCRVLCQYPRIAAIPVVIIADSRDEADEIVAFKVGASDYIAKPFKLKPLMERLRSLLRRCGDSTNFRHATGIGGLRIHSLRKTVEFKGQKLQLTPTECAILELLASSPGHPFDRGEIIRYCHGHRHKVSARTVDVHVRNLRAKLRNHNLIQTLRGTGYFLSSSTEDL
jgi:two-component system phosphate regulon response regulator PhoB